MVNNIQFIITATLVTLCSLVPKQILSMETKLAAEHDSICIAPNYKAIIDDIIRPSVVAEDKIHGYLNQDFARFDDDYDSAKEIEIKDIYKALAEYGAILETRHQALDKFWKDHSSCYPILLVYFGNEPWFTDKSMQRIELELHSLQTNTPFLIANIKRTVEQFRDRLPSPDPLLQPVVYKQELQKLSKRSQPQNSEDRWDLIKSLCHSGYYRAETQSILVILNWVSESGSKPTY
jgi:hypothetical protein